MLTYKDRTWCTYNKTCTKGKTCDRVLTTKDQEVILQLNLPVCFFADYPECFEIHSQEDNEEEDYQDVN